MGSSPNAHELTPFEKVVAQEARRRAANEKREQTIAQRKGAAKVSTAPEGPNCELLCTISSVIFL